MAVLAKPFLIGALAARVDDGCLWPSTIADLATLAATEYRTITCMIAHSFGVCDWPK